MDSNDALVVGAGAAGWSAADTLVRSGWPGPVTIIDPIGPTNRTLVDKGVLTGLLTRDQIRRPAPNGADLRVDEVSAIRADGAAHLRSGERITPAATILATGSRPRLHAFDANEAARERILPLHSAEDAERIRSLLPSSGGRIAILGAGLVGSETASLLADSGIEVTLIARSALPLRSQLGSTVASDLLRRHRERLRVRTARSIAGAEVRSGALVVALADGDTIEADAAIVAYGTEATHPLGTGPGAITVDGRLRTSTPGVYAAGGVASIRSEGGALRVDHWDDAAAQGAHAARSLLHDLVGGPDPGDYWFESGYSSRIHGTTLSAWGAATPGTRWSRHGDGEVVGVGLDGDRISVIAGIDAVTTVRAAWSGRHAESGAPLPQYPVGV